jgi:hypothetical protein
MGKSLFLNRVLNGSFFQFEFLSIFHSMANPLHDSRAAKLKGKQEKEDEIKRNVRI